MTIAVTSVATVATATAIAGSLAPTAAHAFDPTKAPEIQERLLDGLASYELTSTGEVTSSNKPAHFSRTTAAGCGYTDASDVKVNQNCLNLADTSLQGRSQAQNETSIAVDPSNSKHVIASYNDYRRGDGGCGASYSLDGGRSWQDTAVPMSFTRGNAYDAVREYWQAGGDTSVAWDTRGNAYLSCQMFQRGQPTTNNPDTSSAFFVFRSTAGSNGAAWNFTGRPVAESPNVSGGDAAFLDKQLLTVDNHAGSPYRDRVYVTWTTFDVDGTAYIYEAYSNDYGEHFSAPVLVSSDSALCTNSYGIATPNGSCNENQFSQPFTGSDGNLYVAWANFNNSLNDADDNHNQMLLAKSTDGGLSFAQPVKVGDYFDLPDCATYQAGNDVGRACVPEKGTTTHSIFRATNYPSGAVNPLNSGQVVVTYGSYLNKYSNETNGCTPTGFSGATGVNLFTGVKTAGACNNKILYSVSNNGGGTFTGAAADPRSQTTVNSAAQAGTDQFWQWAAFANDGKFAVSYYDRRYGSDETTGASDITLSGTGNLVSWAQTRVTTASMPPPTQFSGLFYGDYTGLAAADVAHPLWMDTRSPDVFLCPGTGVPSVPPAACTGVEGAGPQEGIAANDEDALTRSLAVPVP